MRQGPAFRFVPQLLDDISNVFLLSKNPIQLYIESGIETINMASSLLQLIVARKNARETEATLNDISEKYKILSDLSKDTLSKAKSAEMAEKYLQLKQDIENQNFKLEEVQSFISLIKRRLSKTIEILELLQTDPECPELNRVEELYRRSLRDYNRLVNKYIEEVN